MQRRHMIRHPRETCLGTACILCHILHRRLCQFHGALTHARLFRRLGCGLRQINDIICHGIDRRHKFLHIRLHGPVLSCQIIEPVSGAYRIVDRSIKL